MRFRGAWANTGAAKRAPISALERPCEYAYNGTASQVMPRPKFHAAEATKKDKDACCTPHYRRGAVRARLAYRPTLVPIGILVAALLLAEGGAEAASCSARSCAATTA